MRREEAQTFAEAMGEALGGLANRGNPGSLAPLWANAAGPQAARASRPIGFNGGVLLVEVETRAWSEALEGQRATLEDRLARQLPGFKGLELRSREPQRAR
jgi:hypothetical protein